MDRAQLAPLFIPQGRLLAVDDDKGSLGDPSLQLVRLGVDILLATEVDEARLLARQEAEAIKGVLIPSENSEERIDAVLDAVGPHTGLGPESIALLGRRLDEDRMWRLRERGLRFRLWSPYEDRDLRYLGCSLISAASDSNLRIDARVPTAIPAVAEFRGRAREVLVGDLSSSGAYLETEEPFPAGSMLHVEIALPGGTIRLRATVRWVVRPQQGPSSARAGGFGVEFLRPKPLHRSALLDHLAEEADRFYL
jgi:hypothetical protein